ncbi:MAG TPA: hypothetical protein VE085_07805 [Burkholderiales bacterium]|nr:hypothetical protein [Burkholderiales bacterium]
MKNLIYLADFTLFATPPGPKSAGAPATTAAGTLPDRPGTRRNAATCKPCSVPIRVCEYKSMTVNFPADPDVPCEKMMSPATAGPLQRTYIKTWD